MVTPLGPPTRPHDRPTAQSRAIEGPFESAKVVNRGGSGSTPVVRSTIIGTPADKTAPVDKRGGRNSAAPGAAADTPRVAPQEVPVHRGASPLQIEAPRADQVSPNRAAPRQADPVTYAAPPARATDTPARVIPRQTRTVPRALVRFRRRRRQPSRRSHTASGQRAAHVGVRACTTQCRAGGWSCRRAAGRAALVFGLVPAPGTRRRVRRRQLQQQR
jgi:hypothetical protein